MLSNKELMCEDLQYIWHPCTQMKDHEQIPIIPIQKAKGVYLYDFDGNRYIDAISSWWVNIFGHANEYINEKIKAQLDTLEHVILAGFTHKPAVDLAKKLVFLTPNLLQKVFFADNGSSAIEVALKMSYHYHKNRGEERGLFLSLTNSYHGETIGALSVGDVALYKKTYEPLLIKSIQTPVPKDSTIEAAQIALSELEKILSVHAKQIAAFIVEPLLQGAGGMHIYHKEYLVGARVLTSRYGIHLIVDEIMTGFGRTGEMFATQHTDVQPDFMTLSKGLTGGYLPLSVVLTTDNIYNAFYCDYSEFRAFLHSHSYTGNTLACSAALATLELFETRNTIKNNKILSSYIAKKVALFEDNVCVKSVRSLGMVGVIELHDSNSQERIGLKINQFCLDKGVLIRPLGNVIYLMPPYTITYKELDIIFDVIDEAIKAVC